MRKFMIFATLTLAAKKGESNLERRIRTEGAAGGTAPV
jgi:hypothetical protein